LALLRAALDGCERSLLRNFELWVQIGEEDRDLIDYHEIDGVLKSLTIHASDLAISIWTAPRLHAKVVATE
jgi:hypothetical protein